ncbi:MAG: hypothetical protein ABWY93_27435 [Mycobacterium sp.]
MTLKSLATGVAAVAVVGAAAAGVTSIASGASFAQPQVQPVVFGIPMPQTPAPELSGALTQTLSALAGGGSFSGAKSAYVEGGVGRIEGIAADRAYANAAAKGQFPLTFTVANIDQNGPIATADVTATAATGATASQPMTFIAGPSPSGWVVSKASALNLLSSVN